MLDLHFSDMVSLVRRFNSAYDYQFSILVYRGLSEWDNEKGWLTDTCLDGQDTFKRLLKMYEL